MIAHITIKLAKFLAKYSCKKYNDGKTKTGKIVHRILRHLCRCSLWGLAITDAKLGMMFPRKNYPTQTASGIINTYPYFFQHIDIEEDDALVVDPARFVIKYATSFCAWMIFLLTDKWPTNKVKPEDEEEFKQRERPHDAKYWVEFLKAQDCYNGIVEQPYNGAHFIGVDPSYGQHGLVVWFERMPVFKDSREAKLVFVSTYIGHTFYGGLMPLEDFTWIRIKKKGRLH